MDLQGKNNPIIAGKTTYFKLFCQFRKMNDLYLPMGSVEDSEVHFSTSITKVRAHKDVFVLAIGNPAKECKQNFSKTYKIATETLSYETETLKNDRKYTFNPMR